MCDACTGPLEGVATRLGAKVVVEHPLRDLNMFSWCVTLPISPCRATYNDARAEDTTPTLVRA